MPHFACFWSTKIHFFYLKFTSNSPGPSVESIYTCMMYSSECTADPAPQRSSQPGSDAWMFSTCLVCTSGRAPNVMIDDLLPELHEGISQLLDSLCVSCPGGPVNNAIAFPVQEGLIDGSSMNLAVCRDLHLIPPLQPPHTIADLHLYFALRRSGFLFF